MQKPVRTPRTKHASAAPQPSEPLPETVSKQEQQLPEVEPFPNWAEVLEQLQKRNGALYGAMVDSRAFTRGEMMLVDCTSEMFRSLLRTSVAAKESLRDAIFAVTGQKYNLGPYTPGKYAVAEQKQESDPLAGLLKKANELGVPVEVNE